MFLIRLFSSLVQFWLKLRIGFSHVQAFLHLESPWCCTGNILSPCRWPGERCQPGSLHTDTQAAAGSRIFYNYQRADTCNCSAPAAWRQHQMPFLYIQPQTPLPATSKLANAFSTYFQNHLHGWACAPSILLLDAWSWQLWVELSPALRKDLID